MNSIGPLFSQIVERQNLAAALWAAARGKRQHPEVAKFISDGDAQLSQISEELLAGTFQFQTYKVFEVRDTKRRTIRAPTFRDRVVHHAMINIVGPILEKSAIHHSYACRKGRGQHAALLQASQWTRRGSWYGKVDIRKYYDSVDHELLRQRLRKCIRERELLNLWDRLLDSWSSSAGKGIPIGALTSQYLANFYLDAFDRSMKASGLCHRYLRYMDDIVVWSDARTVPTLRKLAFGAAADLRLELKHGGEWNRCCFGVPLLGFIVYPDRIRLGRAGRRRLRLKYRSLQKQLRHGKVTESEYQARATSLFAHTRIGDDVTWRRKMLSCHSCLDGN